jgi:hypothetical protein
MQPLFFFASPDLASPCNVAEAKKKKVAASVLSKEPESFYGPGQLLHREIGKI